MPAPRPPNEKARLRALRELGILDTPPEERFDRLTRLARSLFRAPVALVTFIDEDRQWLKSAQGVERGENPRDQAICSHTILGEEPLILSDAAADTRFEGNPLVTGEPPIRFYAGAPVHTPDGSAVGTLCVVDYEARELSAADRALLLDLVGLVEEELIVASQSTIDRITGLTNRRGLTVIGQHALALCRRLDRPASVLLLGLDDPPREAEVLSGVGDDLLLTFRDSDVVASLGEGRFAVLLTGAETDQLRRPLSILDMRMNARAERTGVAAPTYDTVAVAYDPDVHHTLDDLVDEATMRFGRSG